MDFVLGDTPTVATGGCAFTASAANGFLDACGTTDVIVTGDERIFVTDGYGKKRVLEYSAAGDRRIREWGGHGTEPGKFTLPHGLAYDGKGVLFVADREGGRIERFDTKGAYLGESGIISETPDRSPTRVAHCGPLSQVRRLGPRLDSQPSVPPG